MPTRPQTVESLISHGVRALGYFWIDLFGFDTPQPSWPERHAVCKDSLGLYLRGMPGIGIATFGTHHTVLLEPHNVKVSIATLLFSNLS